MAVPFNTLLQALRKLPETGPNGFEGLIRDAIELLGSTQLYLVKSGPQKGKDMLSAKRSGCPRLAIEAKRFGAKTPLALDELKQKLAEAIESDDIDIWGVALSKEMVEPDWSEVERIARRHGVVAVALDWKQAPGTLPVLAAILTKARAVVAARLSSVPSSLFDDVEAHPQYGPVLSAVRDQLFQPISGFSLAKDAALEWLGETLKDPELARSRLRGHVDTNSDVQQYVERKSAWDLLEAWWATENLALAAILGDEGRGKSWLALKWSHHIAKGAGAPLVIVMPAKTLEKDEPLKILASGLATTLPDVSKEQLEARLERWTKSGERILLVIDGLNEHFSQNWPEVLQAFEAEPWNKRVRVLVTSRTQYWRSHFGDGRGNGAITEVEVLNYSESELSIFLEQRGRKRGEFSSALLKLMSVPRLATLALSVSDAVKDKVDVTAADLVLADWRSRTIEQGRHVGLDEHGLVDFIRTIAKKVQETPGFEISTREIHATLSTDSGRDLSHYADAISDLVEGTWLENAGRPDKHRPNKLLLPYAIGLDLAIGLEELKSVAEAEEVIATFVEKLRGEDIGVSILRTASSFAVLRNTAAPQIQQALLKAWLAQQNFEQEDFRQFWPLISRHPLLFADMSEQLLAEEAHTLGVREILIKSLVCAAKWPDVRGLLIARLPHWAGSYSVTVESQLGQGNEQELLQQTKTRSALWAEIDKITGLRVADFLHHRSSDLLADAALSIVSFLERAPFWETLIVYAVGSNITRRQRAENAFAWVLRRNEEDAEQSALAIQPCIKKLANVDSEFAKSAARFLACSIATPLALESIANRKAPDKPDSVDGDARSIGRPDHALGARGVIAIGKFGNIATKPTESLPDANLAVLRMFLVSIDTGEATLDQLVENSDALDAVARFAPGAWADLNTKRSQHLLNASPVDIPTYLGLDLEALSATLSEPDARALLRFSDAVPPSSDSHLVQKQLRQQQNNMRAIALSRIPGDEQWALIQGLDSPPEFEARYAHLLRAPSTAQVGSLLQRITPETAVGWLSFLIEVCDRTTVIDDDHLLELAKSDKSSIRAQAMMLLASYGSDRIKKLFAQSDWRYASGMDRHEVVAGSLLLIDNAPFLSIDELAARIVPELLAKAVKNRGLQKEEVAFLTDRYMERIDNELSDRPKPYTVWNIGPPSREAIAAIIKARPEFLSKLRKVIEKKKTFGFLRGFPLVEFIREAITIDPEVAARLYAQALANYSSFNYRDGSLEALALAETESETFALHRSDALIQAKNDSDLLQHVTFALMRKHESWLLSFIHEQLEHVSAGRRALGLRIAGFLDDSKTAYALWDHINELPMTGWLAQVRKRSLASFDANRHAKHWLSEFVSRTDMRTAIDALRLFMRSSDARATLWTRSYFDQLPERKKQHLAVMASEIDGQRKKRSDQLKGSLFATSQVSFVTPWY